MEEINKLKSFIQIEQTERKYLFKIHRLGEKHTHNKLKQTFDHHKEGFFSI